MFVSFFLIALNIFLLFIFTIWCLISFVELWTHWFFDLIVNWSSVVSLFLFLFFLHFTFHFFPLEHFFSQFYSMLPACLIIIITSNNCIKSLIPSNILNIKHITGISMKFLTVNTLISLLLFLTSLLKLHSNSLTHNLHCN